MRPGKGRDLVEGDTGVDVLDYSTAAGGVNVDFPNLLVRGQGRDVFLSTELIVGSPFADTVAGSLVPDTFYGIGGDDVIKGELGDDFLYGGAGNNDIDGGVGSDTCSGSGTLTNCELTVADPLPPI